MKTTLTLLLALWIPAWATAQLPTMSGKTYPGKQPAYYASAVSRGGPAGRKFVLGGVSLATAVRYSAFSFATRLQQASAQASAQVQSKRVYTATQTLQTFGTAGAAIGGQPFSSGFNETELTLTSTVAWSGCLQIRYGTRFDAMSGSGARQRYQLQVDVRDDRSFELVRKIDDAGTKQESVVLHVAFGPGSIKIRVREEVSMTTSAKSAFGSTWVQIRTYRPNVATYSRIGIGCAGTTGPPAVAPVLAAAAGSRPRIGTTFTSVVTNVPRSAPVVGLLGLSNQSFGALKLPLDLTPLGMPKCTLYNDIVLVFNLPSTGGQARWSLPVPEACGLRFYQQAMILAATANPAGVVMSNGGVGTTGR